MSEGLSEVFRFRVVPDPDGSLDDALADLIDNGALEEVTGFSPEAKKAGADALYRRRWGDHPADQNAAIYAECEEMAEAVLAAAWGHITGDK